MLLRENIKLNLKNELKRKFIFNEFEKLFSEFDMLKTDNDGVFYKWEKDGEQYLERNNFGTLWVDNESFGDELKYFSLLFDLPFHRIKTYLLEFMNEKYINDFEGRDLKSVMFDPW
jgi:hypothetical protein